MMQPYHILYTYTLYIRQVTYISISCSGHIGTIILLYYDKSYFIRNAMTADAWFPPHFHPSSTRAAEVLFFLSFTYLNIIRYKNDIFLLFFCHCRRKRPSTHHLHASHSTPSYDILYTHARTHDTIYPSLRMRLHPLRAVAVVVRRARVPRTGGGGGGGGVGRGPPRIATARQSGVRYRNPTTSCRSPPTLALCPHASTSPGHYLLFR